MTEQKLQCVRCSNAPLEVATQSITCHQCNTTYSIFHGVPVLFPNVIAQAVKQVTSEEFAPWLASTMSLPDNPETFAKLKAIFSTTYRFGDFLLDAENNQFLDRLQNSDVNLPKFVEPQHKKTQNDGIVKSDFVDLTLPYPRYKWLLDYLPRVMCAGTTFTGNVRLENVGEETISSHTVNPTLISYHWRTKAGELVIFDGHRTPLPINLSTGRQLTIPMKVETPKEPGEYLLELTLVQEGLRWLDEDAKLIPIEVTSEIPPVLTMGWQISDEFPVTYAEDHIDSLKLLQSRLQQTGKSHLTLLEVGGTAHPMLFHFSGDLYNVDIDIHAMQIGTLLNQHWNKEVQFICADAHALPFPDATFDAIILSSALHHFPDVREFLRSLSCKLRPDGFIAALSEPIGHYYGADISQEFLNDLLKGVNEQTFTLAEYADIFRSTGLEAEVVANARSLKAFLTVPHRKS